MSKVCPYMGEGGGGSVHEPKVKFLESSEVTSVSGVQSSADSPPTSTNPYLTCVTCTTYQVCTIHQVCTTYQVCTNPVAGLPMLSPRPGRQSSRERRAGMAIVLKGER